MNEKGFSLVEMLVTLSILFTASTFIVLPLMSVLIERKNLVLRNEGNVFMQEQIYAFYYDPTRIRQEKEAEGTVYRRVSNETEICITWKNRKQQDEEICREIWEITNGK